MLVNREEDGAFSQPLRSALANRMIHLDIEPDIEAWAAWARENDVMEDVISYLHFAPNDYTKPVEMRTTLSQPQDHGCWVQA